MLAWEFLALLDDFGDAAVADLQLPALAALALEFEFQLAAIDRDMAVAQGRQAKTVVGLGVILIADADQRRLEQMHDDGENLLTRQVAQPHMLVDLGAD